MKIQTFHDLLIGGLCIATTVLAAVTCNHHQQLAAMVAVAAQAQPDPVPALRRDLDLLREGQAKLQATAARSDQPAAGNHSQPGGNPPAA